MLSTRARLVARQDPAACVEMLAEATRIAQQTGADVIAADALITLKLLARRGHLPEAEVPWLADILARAMGPDGLGWSSYGLAAVYAPTAAGRMLATQAVAVLVARGDPDAEPLLTRLRGLGDYYSEVQLDLSEVDLRIVEGRYSTAVQAAEAAWVNLTYAGWENERLLLAARHAAALAGLATAARQTGGGAADGYLAAAPPAYPGGRSGTGHAGAGRSLKAQLAAPPARRGRPCCRCQYPRRMVGSTRGIRCGAADTRADLHSDPSRGSIADRGRARRRR